MYECSKCGGTHIVKAGYSKSSYQLYKCQGCGHRFTNTDFNIGRQKVNFKCVNCEREAFAKKLCTRCYLRDYRLIHKLG